jgi:GT2 family glycosyltransferase
MRRVARPQLEARTPPEEPVRAGAPAARPRVRGKHVFVGEEKLWIRGVTYGPFRPDDAGDAYPPTHILEQDFRRIRASGMNAVRTYAVPPRRVLDAALRHGLWVMVGLPWEQHVAFLDDGYRACSIEERVRAGVRACAGHPAVLCYAIGNEIPASIVRWHGAAAVERFLRRLCGGVKAEDPAALATYVNYPTTEYLRLPFLDLVCFNVYLEEPKSLAAYLGRLQNLAGDRPLLVAELGLDSRRHGELGQARAVDWQIRTSFAAGCAGVFVFAWTDEWHRGGEEVEDWAFGLTLRDRGGKPALTAARAAFAEVPFPEATTWPRVTVVVCSYNGAATIRETLEGLMRLDYPDYEVVVVDDGSTDGTAAIAAEYAVRLIRTENRGLSAARNTGLAAATGEVVAYIDDDAYPDPHWLRYLVRTLLDGGYAGAGGPNLSPPRAGMIAECVAHAPGAPSHVLLTDTVAEHIPGCNMAFLRERLEAVGGFDPRFRVAGDDVDLCWRLQERGWTLGYSAAAVVWHHRRRTVRAYWRQQRGYGAAEALLARKWPQKYNATGDIAWAGRVYGRGADGGGPGRRWRVYHGVWGLAPFQSLYDAGPRGAAFAAALIAGVAGACAAVRAASADARRGLRGRVEGWCRSVVTAWLHVVQPAARLYGRLSEEVTAARRCAWRAFVWPRPLRFAHWSEGWRPPEAWLGALEAELCDLDLPVLRGGAFDDWDLEVRWGRQAAVRLRMAVEEHGRGKQMVRFRAWPVRPPRLAAALLLLGGLAVAAGVGGTWPAAAALGGAALLLWGRATWQRGVVLGGVRLALGGLRRRHEGEPAPRRLEVARRAVASAP